MLKDHVIQLQWSDREALKQIIKQRFEASGQVFDRDWRSFFPEHCIGTDSFNYLVDHTLMRPRDLLSFCKLSIDTALGRGHASVEEEDILHALKQYSSTMLDNLTDEIRDVFGDVQDCLLEFTEEELPLSDERLRRLIKKGATTEDPENVNQVIEKLLEYGFLGLETANGEFSYNGVSEFKFEIILKRAEKYSERSGKPKTYAIHPTFRAALGVR